jgi:aminopeptidase N
MRVQVLNQKIKKLHMTKPLPQTIYLKEYQVPAWEIESTHLTFDLTDEAALVTSLVKYRRNKNTPRQALELSGKALELVSVKIDGHSLQEDDYQLESEKLIIDSKKHAFELEITTRLIPQDNTSLEGLYRSSGNFCTQCEAEGFRKITYYMDRPDVMAKFTTRIIADKKICPVLLSNGNLVEQGDLEDGRHYAVWEDPYKKPAYLFALVAGDLQHVEDSYKTLSGRNVTLRIYTEAHNIDRCDHAMGSLKRAMQWDEERFGLEYDLDIYMIVAVDDFNMGAMENKGLNIFNSKLVFASPETATDAQYINIEAVIGHEYFHNWTGNRVTCRDWFQLSLKEGLTVFRDQEFTADLHSRAVKRIEDVRMLRGYQFAEDASPMAHPIRPSSYIEINNFYTVTVYEKGAEVVRMYQTLLGRDGFRRGMDLYFKRHDGQAVTTEDFLAAMQDANDVNLEQLQNWYDQAGTPTLKVTMDYDQTWKTCTLKFHQSTPKTPESEAKKPFPIPVKLGLLDQSGKDIPLLLEGESEARGTSLVITLTEEQQSFTFVDVPEKPIPSLLRDFSAPVILDYPYSENDFIFLMSHDSDAFNRWEASQQLAMQTMLELLEARNKGEDLGLGHDFVHAFQTVLTNDELDVSLRAEALMLPSSGNVLEKVGENADPDAIHEIVKFVTKTLASALRLDFENLYEQLQDEGEYKIDPQSIGRRKLKNVCLAYLANIKDEANEELCYQQYMTATNMTDSLSAFQALVDLECPQRELVINHFHDRWKDKPQVMDSWFSIQASANRSDTLAEVKKLMTHKLFDFKNPNKLRSLIGSFASNFPVFHALDGSGYVFLADVVLELDDLNPQVGSRLIRPLIKWHQFEPVRSKLMKTELERISAKPGLSKDVYEIVSKSLAKTS